MTAPIHLIFYNYAAAKQTKKSSSSYALTYRTFWRCQNLVYRKYNNTHSIVNIFKDRPCKLQRAGQKQLHNMKKTLQDNIASELKRITRNILNKTKTTAEVYFQVCQNIL